VTSHDSEGALRCEAMLYDYEPEWRPTGIVELDQTDVLAWKRPGWPAGFNRVAYAKWDERTAETRIEELFAFFGDAPFHWHVGPSSSPADLADRLIRRGLVVAVRPRMMTIELPLPAGWPTNDAVRIAEVRDEAIARLSLELAHHNANDIARMLPERMAYITAPWRRGAMMVAYVGDVPVANAAWRYSSDGRCVYLTGAETVEAHRGRGIYKTLIAYRAATAHARGCKVAAVLANSETSAPILARRGFADHGALPLVVPPGVP